MKILVESERGCTWKSKTRFCKRRNAQVIPQPKAAHRLLDLLQQRMFIAIPLQLKCLPEYIVRVPCDHMSPIDDRDWWNDDDWSDDIYCCLLSRFSYELNLAYIMDTTLYMELLVKNRTTEQKKRGCHRYVEKSDAFVRVWVGNDNVVDDRKKYPFLKTFKFHELEQLIQSNELFDLKYTIPLAQQVQDFIARVNEPDTQIDKK